MKDFGRGIRITRDESNIQPYFQLGTVNVMKLEFGSIVTLIKNATQNALTFLTINCPNGDIDIELSFNTLFGANIYRFTASGNDSVWQTVLPLHSSCTDLGSRDIVLDVFKTATSMQLRFRNISTNNVTTDIGYQITIFGNNITTNVTSTVSNVTNPLIFAPTANLSMLQDKTSVFQNEIAQRQEVAHYGSNGIGRVFRRLNAATFANLTTSTNTAVHIALQEPTSSVLSTHIIKLSGSVINSFGAYYLPIELTAHAYWNGSSITKKDFFQQGITDYVSDFYIATAAPHTGKLVLKITRNNAANAIGGISFIVDTIAGGANTANAMKVTAIIENANINL